MKYGVSANLTADFTVNTDFAQVEVDEQQVKPHAVSVCYIREARLLSRRARAVRLRANAGQATSNATVTPQLFYSRRIGLNSSRIIPIDAGARLTRQVGPLRHRHHEHCDASRSVVSHTRTDFTVVRVKRDIPAARIDRFAVPLTARRPRWCLVRQIRPTVRMPASRSFQNVNLGGYWARSDTEGRRTDNDSYQGGSRYRRSLGCAGAMHEGWVELQSEVGFVRRANMRRSYGLAKFAPRPKVRFKSIRQFTYQGTLESSRTGPDSSNRVSRTDASPSNGRTAISSRWM